MDPLILNLFWRVVIPAVILFALLVSLCGVAVGVGLILRGEATLAFLRTMNRWVSTRILLRPLEVPREVGAGGAAAGARWLGPALVIGGGILLVVLLASYGEFRSSARFTLQRGSGAGVVVLIALESLYLVLALGSALAVAVGAVIWFFPRAWPAIEERANRWYSLRQMTMAGDRMHLPLDRLAETHRRAAGWTISVVSALSAIAFAVLVFSRLWR